LTVVASADLGGLGAKEGAPVSYDWSPPSIIPLLLPWLAILALLALKPNRHATAWWIWVPLGGMAALAAAIPSSLTFLPSSAFDALLELIIAVVFGLAAVWLLAPRLAYRHRFITFLCVLAALEVFTAFSHLVRQDWVGEEVSQALGMLVVLTVGVLVIASSLAFAGLTFRGRYRPAGLYLRLFIVLLIVWLVLIGPFFAFAMIASGGQIPWWSFFSVTLICTSVTFAVLLPFLILSSANSFFRERLKAMLHLERPAPPPVVTPAPLAGPVN